MVIVVLDWESVLIKYEFLRQNFGGPVNAIGRGGGGWCQEDNFRR